MNIILWFPEGRDQRFVTPRWHVDQATLTDLVDLEHRLLHLARDMEERPESIPSGNDRGAEVTMGTATMVLGPSDVAIMLSRGPGGGGFTAFNYLIAARPSPVQAITAAKLVDEIARELARRMLTAASQQQAAADEVDILRRGAPGDALGWPRLQ